MEREHKYNWILLYTKFKHLAGYYSELEHWSILSGSTLLSLGKTGHQ